MVRTQIYLTESERAALKNLSRRTGQKQSELIRRAIDEYVARFQPRNRQALLQEAKGMWQGRDDLPDFGALRREMERCA